MDIVKRVAARFRKLAGWWGTDPMGGDSPLDILHIVGGIDPRKASNLIEKLLKSHLFTERYTAMGVWDVVMSSGVGPYVQVFEYLSDDVAAAARKGVPRGDDWEHDQDVQRWLKLYSRGQPTGKLKRHKFVPRTLKGGIWYISRATADERGGDIEVVALLKNRYTGGTKELEETLDGPDVGVEQVETNNYGGEKSRQQSILIEVHGEGGESYDRQLDVDPQTGEWMDLGEWGGPY